MSINNLTKREKKSIYFLICFLIAAIGLLAFIFPTYNQYHETELALINEQSAKERMDIDIALLPDLKQTLPELQRQVRMAAGYFYQPMTTDEADQLVTALLTKHGFKPVALALDTFVATTVPPYLSEYTNALPNGEENKADSETPETGEEFKEPVTAGDSEDTEPATDENQDNGSQAASGQTVLAGSHITAIVTARTLKPFQDLCDEVSNMAGLRILSYSYQQSTASLFSTNAAPNVYEFNIEFEVLTYQPTQMGTGYEINEDNTADAQEYDVVATK